MHPLLATCPSPETKEGKAEGNAEFVAPEDVVAEGVGMVVLSEEDQR